MNDSQTATATTRPGDTGLGLPVAQSADPIDQVVRLAPKWTIAVLVACALMIAAAVVWAFAGEVTQTVSEAGVLRDTGYQTVDFTSAGTVKAISVKVGDHITVGTLVVELEGGGQLLSSVEGYVTSVYKARGARVQPGDTAVSITDYTLPDKVFVLLPSSMMGSIGAGLPVEVEFSNAPAAQFGYAKGWIETLSPEPMTAAELAQRTGMPKEVLEAVVGDEPGLATLIGLKIDLHTKSTLAWTVGKGPNFVPTQGTPVTVNVILSAQRPIDLLFPGGRTARTAKKATS